MSGPECSEWQGIMAMDAIGRATADESRELAGHLEQCEACRADAADVRSAAGALTLLDLARVDGPDRDVEPALSPFPLRSLEPESPFPPFELAPQLTPTAISGDAISTEDPPSVEGLGVREGRTRRRWLAGAGVVMGAVAAAGLAVLLVASPPSAPTTKVALSGTPGVAATVSLTTQPWGTRATLVESGQAAGQVLTVWMKDSTGHWWQAGSYRTTGRSGTLEVPLSCAVQAGRITHVYVRDQAGQPVLSGYVS
jgi:hypothetical protein